METTEPIVDFLSRQRDRFRAKLNRSIQIVEEARREANTYDVEVRKQPGTLPCISHPYTEIMEQHNREPKVY
jgi:hypothetical protein